MARFKKGEGGRPKGAKNKATKAFKEAVLEAFNRLGGVDAFTEWARDPKNQTAFYAGICTRLIPQEQHLTGKVDSENHIHHHQIPPDKS